MKITDLRVSLVFGETIDLTADLEPPCPYVVFPGAYVERFDRDASVASASTRPWPNHGQLFWERYLGQPGTLRDVSGRQAYKQQVPVRFPLPPPRARELPAARFAVEAFAYPWGTALVVSGAMEGSWSSPQALAECALTLRHVTLERDGEPPVHLDAYARRTLERQRAMLFGEVEAKLWNPEPFTVATPVSGEVPGSELQPERAEPTRRLLHALSSFSATFAVDQLSPLDACRVARRRDGPTGHVVYGTRRGRAVWGPHHMSRRRGEVHSLACQHRNLVFAAMQTESLGAFTVAGAQLFATAGQLPAGIETPAQLAADALVRLYAGTTSYKSGSVKAHIAGNDLAEPISVVRVARGKPAFSLT